MSISKLVIQRIPIKKLKPAEYNPRKDLTPEDIEYQKIKQSIIDYGCVLPLVVNKDMTIIGGHQRLKIVQDLGYEEIECVIVDFDKDKEKSCNIILNNEKISGKWDFEKLESVINELAENEYDLRKTGLDDEEIQDLLDDLDVKDEDFLQGTEIVKDRKLKEVICPNCGYKLE